MNVLLMSRYGRLAPSSRLRSYQYLPYLRAHGIQVTVSPLLGDGYVRDLYDGKGTDIVSVAKAFLHRIGSLLRTGRFHLVWIEYELFPWLPAWGEALLCRLGIPYVVDYDDAVFHRYDLHRRRFVRKLLGRKIDNVMRRAAMVMAGNAYLADRARKAGAHRVEVLPTVVDLDRYPLRRKGGKKERFTIGWIGSPTTAPYLRAIGSALAKVILEGNGRLVLVGCGDAAFGFQGVPVEIHEWSEASEVEEIQDFHVGIMPLPDTPWTRGKCGYKLIQYMACGIPVVASPVGVNTGIAEHGKTGFLAGTDKDWVEALTTLRENPELGRRMGREGRKKVEAHYALKVTAPRLMEVLLSASRARGPDNRMKRE